MADPVKVNRNSHTQVLYCHQLLQITLNIKSWSVEIYSNK